MPRASISVVVPIYNTGKYLKRCINSISNQTLTTIEILLINDASTDNSGEIAESLALEDSRIRVIHQPQNAGLSAARNKGIEEATGEYIYFVDSDDWVDTDMMEKIYNIAKKDESQILRCGFKKYLNNKIYKQVSAGLPAGVYKGEQVKEKFLYTLIGLKTLYSEEKKAADFCTITTLYHLDTIKNSGVRFESERVVVSEDYFFNIHLLMHVSSISVIEENLYNHDTRLGSLTTSYKPNVWDKRKYALEKIKDLLSQNNMLEVCEKRLNNNYINCAIEAIIDEASINKKASLKERFNNIYNIANDPILNNIFSDYSYDGMSKKGKIIVFLLRHKLVLGLYLGYNLAKKHELKSAEKFGNSLK